MERNNITRARLEAIFNFYVSAEDSTLVLGVGSKRGSVRVGNELSRLKLLTSDEHMLAFTSEVTFVLRKRRLRRRSDLRVRPPQCPFPVKETMLVDVDSRCPSSNKCAHFRENPEIRAVQQAMNSRIACVLVLAAPRPFFGLSSLPFYSKLGRCR